MDVLQVPSVAWVLEGVVPSWARTLGQDPLDQVLWEGSFVGHPYMMGVLQVDPRASLDLRGDVGACHLHYSQN